MLTRLLAAAGLVLVLGVTAFAMPAAAVEEGAAQEGEEQEHGPAPHHGDLPGIDEVGSQTEVAREFFPEDAEEQPFTEAFLYPLLAIGILATLVILVMYLRWQPEFSREQEERSRR